jgi:DNA-binding NtrC family response regulator
MTNPRSVLVVDDDAAMREMVVSLLEESGLTARGCGGAEEALDSLQDAPPDAVLTDIRMPGKSGVELLGEIHELRPSLPVILMTAFGSIDSAVGAMRSGAFDYVTKPFKKDQLLVVLERAFERLALEEENQRLRRAVDQTTSFGELIGASPAMREIFALVRKVANSRSSVLVTGESGTGKEVVARTIHFNGILKDAAFIPVNCTAIPEGLLESELFGHVRGAFTGAHASKRGLFEEANGGTLFLDEIGDMGPSLQAKILRVLQDGEVRPVGGNKAIKVDVRIIAATNKDLQEEMDSGRFRRDLFYRLNVIPLHIPPLRERPDDIPLLADYFVKRHAGDRRLVLAPGAVSHLLQFRFEGNARELENWIERAIALTEGPEIGPDSFPDGDPTPIGMANGDTGSALVRATAERRLTLEELKDLYVEEVLRLTGGNKVQAARILGIDRRTLYRRREREARRTAHG